MCKNKWRIEKILGVKDHKLGQEALAQAGILGTRDLVVLQTALLLLVSDPYAHQALES